MTFEKLTITPEKGHSFKELKALFNPSELKLMRSVSWQELQPANGISGGLQFAGTSPWTLALDIFFDTYDRSGDVALESLVGALPGIGLITKKPLKPISVLDVMAPLLALTVPATELHRPPACDVTWGTFLFRGVLQQANPTLTLFHEDGTPMRATVACTFQGWINGDEKVEFHSPDVVKRHTVQPGDTLMALASHYYEDRAQWRRIADANRIENPRILPPGTILTIPRIR